APGVASVGGCCKLDVELLVAIVLPRGKQIAIGRIDGNAGVIIGADEGSRNTLFRTSSEVAPGLARNYIVPYLDRRTTFQVGCACLRASQSMTYYAKLLPVGVVRRCVAIIEDNYQVPGGLRRWVRTLIEITGVRATRRIEKITEKAKRIGVPADPLRSRPRKSVVG